VEKLMSKLPFMFTSITYIDIYHEYFSQSLVHLICKDNRLCSHDIMWTTKLNCVLLQSYKRVE